LIYTKNEAGCVVFFGMNNIIIEREKNT